jgi:hypothetical protein
VDENGNPLAGATIQVKGTNFTVASDSAGSFELPGEFSDSDLQYPIWATHGWRLLQKMQNELY